MSGILNPVSSYRIQVHISTLNKFFVIFKESWNQLLPLETSGFLDLVLVKHPRLFFTMVCRTAQLNKLLFPLRSLSRLILYIRASTHSTNHMTTATSF